MNTTVTIAFLLAYSGMLGLCLGLERHFKQLWRRAPAVLVRRTLRVAGWCCLAGSVVVSAHAWGWAMGSVAAFGLVSLAGLVLVLLLPYAERWVLLLAAVAWPAVGLLAAVQVA